MNVLRVSQLVLTASEEVRSLIFAPLLYSQVPYEVLMSYTDNVNIQLLSLTSKPLKDGLVLRSVL